MYSGVLCDVMDGMGYRSQSIARTVMPLKDHTVIFGPAFTSIGTQVYSMPADPLTAQCRVVDQVGGRRGIRAGHPRQKELRRVR